MYIYRSYNKVPRYHGVSILTVQLDWLLKEKPLEKQRLIICWSVVNRELMHSGTSVTLVLARDIGTDELERQSLTRFHPSKVRLPYDLRFRHYMPIPYYVG